MRADSIASHGRTGAVGALSISTVGRLSRLGDILAVIRDSVNAFTAGFSDEIIKIFRAVTEMDRVFRGTTDM